MKKNVLIGLSFIKGKLQYLMIAAIVLGLGNVYFLGGWSISKNLLVFIIVVFVIFPVMVNTKFEEIFAHFKEPRPVFCSIFLNFLLSPLIAYGLGKLFLSNQPDVFTALIIVALIPTSAMSVAWTAFSGANMSTALYLVPINILFAAFIGLPFIFPLLVGDMLSLNKFAIVKNIVIVFFIPLILGDISRRLIVKKKGKDFYQERVKPRLGEISAVGILVLVFLVMSLQRNTVLLENTDLVLLIFLPVILYYSIMYAVSFIWTKLLIRLRVIPGNKAVVIIYTSVARHVNISIAITLSVFALETASIMIVLFVVAYIVQVPSLAIFAQKFGKDLAVRKKVEPYPIK